METELTSLTNFKPINYKFVVDAHVIVYPLDRNGNTYHRVTICDQQGNEIADSKKVYGYGSQYEVTAKEMIAACIALPKKYKVGKPGANRNTLESAFRDMRDNKFLKINYIVKN